MHSGSLRDFGDASVEIRQLNSKAGAQVLVLVSAHLQTSIILLVTNVNGSYEPLL